MLSALEELDKQIFSFFNSFADQSALLDWFFVFSAEYLVFLLGIGVLVFWFVGEGDARVQNRMAVFTAAVSAVLGRFGIVTLIRTLYFRPRPFIADSVHQLVAHNPAEASFPSGHAAILFALAFSMFFVNRKWGTAFLLFAIVSSLSRIVVGVHYPMDILAGFFAGALAVLLSRLLLRGLRIHERLRLRE